MRRFEYHEPASLDEASALLVRHGADASLLAGGTDLLVEIKEHLRWPQHVVNVKKIPGLAALEYDERNGLRFGALVTARAIETAAVVRARYAGLAQAARELGSIQVRHRATVVGNICRASPSADTLPPLIADGASVRIHGPAGGRTVALEDFFIGPGRTVLAPGELVTEVVVPPPAPRTGKHYIKHGRRKAMELATVGVAVALTLERDACRDIRIALGAVAPTPIRARAAEAALRGRALDGGTIAAAARTAMGECRPISNVRGSAEYRREMVGVLVARAIERAREGAG
ncbi:MAG: xanthine dehydrogenase family protein subunit M [Burkholderiales bacterium]